MTSNDPLQAFLDRIEGVRPQGNGQWIGQCPCPEHIDRHPSFSFGRGDTQPVVFKCLAGCEQDAILDALDLTWADILGGSPNGHHKKATPKRDTSSKPPPKVYATLSLAVEAAERQIGGKQTDSWNYQLANGDDHFRVVRFDVPGGGKEFRPFHRTDRGWVMKDPPGNLPLYHAPEVSAAKPGSTIHLFEGEKCVEAARDLGIVATTSAHGCKAPGSSDWTPLSGHRVLIFPDADSGGEKYGQAVAGICSRLDPPTIEIKVVTLPDLEPGGDIVDFIESRRLEAKDDRAIRVEIEAWADQTPVWTPGTAITHQPPATIDVLGPYPSRRESMAALNDMGDTARRLRDTNDTLAEQVSEWLDRKGPDKLEGIDFPVSYAAAIIGVTRSHFHRLGQIGRVRRLLRACNTPTALSDRAVMPLARLLPGQAEAIPQAVESAKVLAATEAQERGLDKPKPVNKRHTSTAVDSIIGPVELEKPVKRAVRRRSVDTADEIAVEAIRQQIAELAEAVAVVASVPAELRALVLKVAKHYWSVG